MLWQWNAPVEGKPRRGQPCKVVRPDTPQKPAGADDRARTIERITVEFTDGTRVEAPRRAVRMRKWVVDAKSA